MKRAILAMGVVGAVAAGLALGRWGAWPTSPPASSPGAEGSGVAAMSAAWRAVQADSRNPVPWAALGDAQTAIDDLVGAEQSYLTAVRLGSRDPTVHGRLGFALYAQGLDERALQALLFARQGGAQLPLLDHTIEQLRAQLGARLPERSHQIADPPPARAAAAPSPAATEPAVAAPPPPAPPPAVPPLAGPCEVPLRRSSRSGIYLVPARIEGVEATLVFDTGATVTALGRDLLRRAGVHIDEDRIAHAFTAAGPVEVATAMVGRVDLAGRQAREVMVAVCDACAGQGIDGLLGLDVQSAVGAELDLARSVLRLGDCGAR